MKVLIIDGNNQYHKMFKEAGFETTLNIEEADLLQFTGGQDVSPFLYGQPTHHTTYSDPRRDLVECGYFAWGVRLGKKMAGICRGGQFLNVMSGGAMYQDVDSHAIHNRHLCHDIITDREHLVTSTHHQMMKPGKGGEIIAIAGEAENLVDYDGEKFITIEGHDDIEVVYYKDTKSLCYQPHPEFPGAHTTREYYFELLKRYLEIE